jgi:hypothetical protein
MAYIVETPRRVVIPKDGMPEKFKLSGKMLDRARGKNLVSKGVDDDIRGTVRSGHVGMAVESYKKMLKAQSDVENALVVVLYVYFKHVMKVDLSSRPHFGYGRYTVTVDGTWNKGSFVVTEYMDDDRGPTRTMNKWVIPKTMLLKLAQKSLPEGLYGVEPYLPKAG